MLKVFAALRVTTPMAPTTGTATAAASSPAPTDMARSLTDSTEVTEAGVAFRVQHGIRLRWQSLWAYRDNRNLRSTRQPLQSVTPARGLLPGRIGWPRGVE